MERMLLNLIYFLAYYSGIIDLCYRFRNTPIVVSYHNIIPDELYRRNQQFIGGDHSESEFDAHLAIIKSKVSITNTLEPGKVLITFDDGYRNNFSIVQPILHKHEVRATFFVPACYHDSPDILWVDKMLMWISFVPSGIYSLLQREYTIETKEERKSLWEDVWGALLTDFSLKDNILRGFENNYSFSKLQVDEDYRRIRFQVLSLDELNDMKNDGNKVACHSYNHDILAKLSEDDLHDNYMRCEQHKDTYNVAWFSYPFGRETEVSDMVVEKCRQFGYSDAFMNVNTNSRDRYRHPRINMPNSVNKTLIHAKLSGFEKLLKNALRRSN